MKVDVGLVDADVGGIEAFVGLVDADVGGIEAFVGAVDPGAQPLLGRLEVVLGGQLVPPGGREVLH